MSKFIWHADDVIFIKEAVDARVIGLGGYGFCMACRTEHDECPADLEAGECMDCGSEMVFSAEKIARMIS